MLSILFGIAYVCFVVWEYCTPCYMGSDGELISRKVRNQLRKQDIKYH